METSLSARLRKQAGGPRDGALLRFSLGNALIAESDIPGAIEEFRVATQFDPRYSAAWKLLGSALDANGETGEAEAAWEQGIVVAQERGDTQAAKEMQVFLRRLRKRTAS